MDEILHQYSNACGHRKAQTPRTPQFNVVSCLVCVMQDFGHSTFLCFTCFLHSMLKREREGIYEFVLPLVQDFVHQPSGQSNLSVSVCQLKHAPAQVANTQTCNRAPVCCSGIAWAPVVGMLVCVLGQGGGVGLVFVFLHVYSVTLKSSNVRSVELCALFDSVSLIRGECILCSERF